MSQKNQVDFQVTTDELLGVLMKKERQIQYLEMSLEKARKRIDELMRDKVEKPPDEA